MKKRNIIMLIVALVILIGLIIFASTHKYQDSHLRIEGVRVKLGENSLIVEDCDYKNLAYCEKKIKVGDEEQTLVFQYKNFKKNGFPSTASASLNGKEFYHEDNLNIEENYSSDFKAFLNFKVILDKYIFFTFTKGSNMRSTTLYALDTEGNIVLQEYEIDNDNMVLKDYTDFITYNDNQIEVYATKLVNDREYNDQNVCDIKASTIVEAYYTYTFKDNKFTKKQTKTITAKEFIKDNDITCE